jgi:hypothetical protein
VVGPSEVGHSSLAEDTGPGGIRALGLPCEAAGIACAADRTDKAVRCVEEYQG